VIIATIPTRIASGRLSSPGSANTLLVPTNPAPVGSSADQISGQQTDSFASFGTKNVLDAQAVVAQVLE